MKFENTDVWGFEHAIRGMRNPMNSWSRSDSMNCFLDDCVECNHEHYCYIIGENDMNLAQRLIKGGSEHRKFLRQIFVSVDITAPLYWWSEFDTYKVGTTANSTSKMHKMLAKPFDMRDFSFNQLPGYKNEIKQYVPSYDYDNEIWRQIGYTDYMVSNMGRIKNKNKVLGGSHHKDGYVFVTIKGKQMPVHRIVANAFVKNINNKPEINHIDGNKKNNAANNLEWTTRSENQQHAVDNNLQPKTVSTYKGKFTEDQRNEIKALWNSGNFSKRELASKYKVSHTCICDIINDKYMYSCNKNLYELVARPLIDSLNELRDDWLKEENAEKKKTIWYTILSLLPVSYNQTRTVTMNYENLRNMYFQRKGHKLTEWSESFVKWIESLPYAKELIMYTGEDKQ